jgi:hypothetical protein
MRPPQQTYQKEREHSSSEEDEEYLDQKPPLQVELPARKLIVLDIKTNPVYNQPK